MWYIHNVDIVLGEIQDGVNKNKISLAEYKKESELSLTQNEFDIKKLLQTIEKGWGKYVMHRNNGRIMTLKLKNYAVCWMILRIKIRIFITNLKKIVQRYAM